MAHSEILSKNGAQKTEWSEEFERMPLKQRLKLLFASNRISVDSELKSEQLQNKCHLGDFNHEKDSEHKCVKSSHVPAAGVSEKGGSVGRSSLQESLVVENPIKVKTEDGENGVESCLGACMNISNGVGIEAETRLEFLDELDHVVLKERLRRLVASESLGLSSPVLEASCYLSGDSRIVQTPHIPSLANVKVEPPNPDEFRSSNVSTVDQMSYSNFVLVKAEVQTAGDAHEDDLDHMLLRERMKLLSSRNAPSLNTDQSPKSMSKMMYSASGCRLDRSKDSKPAHLKINRPRKRRKTATDSVETAMEEDAPGLLQVLIDKGVTVDEIKLYGEPESNDALDDSSTEDSFGELEEVITKLFSQRESLLKYAPLRCSKGERVNYCLECLFSLVEQARYLQFRRWPVEWGWCRDLQSFIFVFERHNRIVLERPEYGYATYFFELADSLPIAWQIKRLVTAMKLTSCSRITLIENRALMVGDDLSEGEAKVLMEYGWIPNTGLGSMLNYYDRVFHDRRNEKDGSEWRSKIGKLLMDGYNGGTIISTAIPTKVMEYNAANAVEIKLELS
ncbi:uncharacterized protein LOC131021881 [Salvia miltiorrhiza]|uniref:uncharacterized protein LOC131021881 n=1 Tax=Salvia miltiorrhiza TaxID=226208 RepID=UPI0025AC5121|nr:uncharacterized protein LOC131021881 [Salvia miltiorrhiza]